MSHAEATLSRSETTSSRPDHGRSTRRGRVMAGVAGLSVVLAAVAWLVVSSVTPPLRTACAPAMSPGACAESVTAALSRGLPRPHGLLLAARVVPGPAAAPGRLGHRATVTFEVLGAPGPVSVALYLDMGGHWGGVVDRDRAEVAMVPVIQSLAILGLGLVMVWVTLVMRRHRDASPDRRRGGDPWNEPT